MATVQEIITIIARRLVAKYSTEDVIRPAMQGMTDAEWLSIAGWIDDRDANALLSFVAGRVQAKKQENADAEAATIYSDQTLSHTEIERIFF